ncbi:hypothetical protein BGZ60DRAFT_522359 [Tricladium varicosporioides]|nr:hypothetical protein BGZ60DRAFT_522359 [Hymenoscyphus varicosporioides]
MSKIYDILIIGGGPAGLSTASSIVRQNHSTLVLDSQTYRNAKSDHMHTIPTWDHKSPAEFRAAATQEFGRYGTVRVENAEVKSVKKIEGGGFEANGAEGEVWKAKKLVLATGMIDEFPDIMGYEECWVLGIFHCLYCRGWEERNATSSGILCEGDMANVMVDLHVARQALQLTKEVTMYTLGNEQLAKEINAATASYPQMKADPRNISKLTKGPNSSEVVIHFEDGTTKTEGFLSHKPKSKLRGDLANQLGLEINDKGVIQVYPPFNETSVSGVFACGDCAAPMQTVTQAIYSGTLCGAGAPLQLQAETYGQKPLF